MQELRAAFDLDAVQTGRVRLLLTMAVGAWRGTVDDAYEVPELSQYVQGVQRGGGGRILEGGVVTSRYRVANAGTPVPCMFFPHLFFRGRENVALKDGAEMRGK